MYDRDMIYELMQKALVACLKFIKSYKGTPPSYEKYTDIKVDYKNKQWSAYPAKSVNLYKWPKSGEMLSIPEVAKVVNHFFSLETKDVLDPRDETKTFFHDIAEGELQRIRTYRVLPFISAYINRCGLSFDTSCFDYIFNAWFSTFQGDGSKYRVLVLRNFILEGLESIDLLNCKIRPLKNYEVKSLITFGAYNVNTARYNSQDMPTDLKGELNPMYCAELPPLAYGDDNEENSTELIKNQLLGLLLTFKGGMISAETELDCDAMGEFQISPGIGAKISWNELHHYFTSPYVLRQTEYAELSNYQRHYSDSNLNNDKALNLAIRRYLRSNWRYEAEDIVIDNIIALEALLSDSEQEIQYRISIRLAFLIGQNPEDRPKIFDIMKHFYAIRSNIVHGNAKEVNDVIKKIGKYFTEQGPTVEETMREYVRLTIQKYIYQASINSDGKNKEHFLKYLDDKVLRLK